MFNSGNGKSNFRTKYPNAKYFEDFRQYLDVYQVVIKQSLTALSVNGRDTQKLATCYFQGVLGTDMELAGSLWRSFFQGDKELDPVDLENMVRYVRKQVMLISDVAYFYIM